MVARLLVLRLLVLVAVLVHGFFLLFSDGGEGRVVLPANLMLGRYLHRWERIHWLEVRHVTIVCDLIELLGVIRLVGGLLVFFLDFRRHLGFGLL